MQSGFVLARNHVGRVAFVSHGRPELLPVHYVYADQTIFGRTSFGAKACDWIRGCEVVFEVDEPHDLFEWRSVVARGTIQILTPEGTGEQQAAYVNAIAAMRRISPETLTERDPTPNRRLLFSIHPSELTGREASNGFSRTPSDVQVQMIDACPSRGRRLS